MRRRAWIIGTVAVIAALAVGTVGGYFLFLTHPTALTILRSQGKAFTLPGHVPPLAKQAHDNGEYSSQQPLNLSISLPLSITKKAELQAKLALMYDPASPTYHQFMTPQQYRDEFGLQPDTISKVKTYLESQKGLTVTGISPTGQLINVSGSVPAVESAFGVKIHQYTLTANGKTQTYFAPVNDPQIPIALSGVIQGISGLDNFSVYRSGARLKAHASGSGYTPSDLEKAYDASGLISKGDSGSGQNVAFLELDGYNASDVQSYQQQYGVTGGSFETVSVDGANYDQNPGQGAVEVQLDMEVAFGIAPKIHELVYEGQNSGQGINDVYSQIVNDDKAKIVSISWGLCEAQTGSAELQTLDSIFQQGAAEGISFFAAAGDSGAYDCGDTNLAVDSPADDPYVTGVGGTSLTLNNGSYGSEQAWSCTTAKCTSQNPQGEGGGGGISQQFPVPNFQKNLNPAGAQGQTGRFVPDVSADADPATGYAIVCTVSSAGCDSSQGPLVVGGTSAAAPVWAAGTALMAQSLGKPLGNINAALYGTSEKGFHDVTQGSNLYYNAGPGYDLATGLGSPDFAALAPALTITNTGGGGGNPTPTPTPNPGGGNNPTPTPNPGGGNPTPAPGPTGAGQELLTNNGFENGQDPWAEASAGGYQLITTDNPHSGKYSAFLCGYTDCQDEIAQGFTIPQGASTITLSYWWEMQTQKSGACADHFTVTIDQVNSDGTLGAQVAQVQDTCNTDANNRYEQKTVDLSSALQSAADGQTVLAVVFSGTTDGSSSKTAIYVDDVSLQAQ